MRADQLKALIALGLPTEVLQQVVDIVTRASPGASRTRKWRDGKVTSQSVTEASHETDLGTIGVSNLISLEEKKVEKKFLSRPPSRFPEFKAAYPKRSGSTGWAKAEKIFDRLVAKGIPPDTLIDGAASYCEQQEALEKVGTEFVKMAQTWLNQEGWKDVEAAESTSFEERYRRAREAFRSSH
jgi:hypothetical protein